MLVLSTSRFSLTEQAPARDGNQEVLIVDSLAIGASWKSQASQEPVVRTKQPER
jgi:hypothetical protein